jgi:hypothetical protein
MSFATEGAPGTDRPDVVQPEAQIFDPPKGLEIRVQAA